jgi:hypothetical protein
VKRKPLAEERTSNTVLGVTLASTPAALADEEAVPAPLDLSYSEPSDFLPQMLQQFQARQELFQQHHLAKLDDAKSALLSQAPSASAEPGISEAAHPLYHNYPLELAQAGWQFLARGAREAANALAASVQGGESASAAAQRRAASELLQASITLRTMAEDVSKVGAQEVGKPHSYLLPVLCPSSNALGGCLPKSLI